MANEGEWEEGEGELSEVADWFVKCLGIGGASLGLVVDFELLALSEVERDFLLKNPIEQQVNLKVGSGQPESAF